MWRPYSVLHPVGFTVPLLLPVARCALAAPFRPYRAEARRNPFCGTVLDAPRGTTGRYPAPWFHGARTFLGGASSDAAARPSGKRAYRGKRVMFRVAAPNVGNGWKAGVARAAHRRHRKPMPLRPESQFIVQVTAQDEIVCRAPAGQEQRIRIADLGCVYFETSDGGPFGVDWWLLNDRSGELVVSFPLGATGEDAALDRLRQLPEFRIDGMNATGNARFLCWEAPTA